MHTAASLILKGANECGATFPTSSLMETIRKNRDARTAQAPAEKPAVAYYHDFETRAAQSGFTISRNDGEACDQLGIIYLYLSSTRTPHVPPQARRAREKFRPRARRQTLVNFCVSARNWSTGREERYYGGTLARPCLKQAPSCCQLLPL